MGNYIKDLIAKGENQQLDFKFEISDSRKLARTLVAFANTDGGKLLVGVKDNGSIAGVRSEEEYYMVEAAARMYCKPPVNFVCNRWTVDGKTVLEVTVTRSYQIPHSASDSNGRNLVYIRVNDQNLLANNVLLQVWKNKEKEKPVALRYTESERILLEYLSEHPRISLNKFSKLARISRRNAEQILITLVSLDVISMQFTEKDVFYSRKGAALDGKYESPG
jgi:predicted HTH transcriptional regulator